MRCPDAFFDATHEHPINPIIDLENPYVLLVHLICAAAKLPYRNERDEEYLGHIVAEILRTLKEEHILTTTPK